MATTLVFLPGEFHVQRSLAGYSPWGSQRVRHDWATNTSTHTDNLLCPFLSWQMFRLLPCLDYCKQGCCEHKGASSSSKDLAPESHFSLARTASSTIVKFLSLLLHNFTTYSITETPRKIGQINIFQKSLHNLPKIVNLFKMHKFKYGCSSETRLELWREK